MKSILSALLLAIIVLMACKGRKSKMPVPNPNDSTVQSKMGPTSLTALSDEMQKKVEELKKLTPVNADHLETMMPDHLVGFIRVDIDANNSLGFAATEARYEDSASGRHLSVSVIDCAGEAGAGEYSIAYWMKLNTETETDDGYTKSIDFNGQKAVESYDKDNDQFSLSYVASARLLVNVKGERTALDTVKLAARDLRFKIE